MDLVQLTGLTFVMIGVTIVIGAGWALRTSMISRQRRFQVVGRISDSSFSEECVLVPVTPEPGAFLTLRLAEDWEMSAVNAGDVLWVYPDPMVLSRVRLYRPVHTMFWAALVMTGTVLGVAGAIVLGGLHDPGVIDTTRGAIGVPLITAFSACLGAVGLVGVTDLALGWQGSRRVTGSVVAVEVVLGTRKNSYRPLIEYPAGHDTVRKVWGARRAFRPDLGRLLTVRLSGRPPHEAMHTTPMFLCSLLIFLGFGLFGWLALFATLSIAVG